ncbi:MAG: hypothetical protein ABJI85_05960, partial [Reichenbachiella sp.]
MVKTKMKVLKMNKSVKSYASLIICLLLATELYAQMNPSGSKENHPRIYVNQVKPKDFAKSLKKVKWKTAIIEKKQERVDQYLTHCASDPDWMVSRLQMNWKTKHDKVYLRGGDFSHSEGEAPVPTVRFSGTRDWATDYMRPSIEDVKPY